MGCFKFQDIQRKNKKKKPWVERKKAHEKLFSGDLCKESKLWFGLGIFYSNIWISNDYKNSIDYLSTTI